MFTVDTSVWINAVSSDENEHESSRLFLDTMLDLNIPLITPTLLTVELYATMARQSFARAEQLEVMGQLNSLQMIHWVSLDEDLSERAAALVMQTKLRAGDAVFGAVALQAGSTLISLDKEHLDRLPPLVRAMTPASTIAYLRNSAP